jgi:thiol-disulfide isomerase/thioredoxin
MLGSIYKWFGPNLAQIISSPFVVSFLKIMKHIIFLAVLIAGVTQQISAQTGAEMLQNYKAAIGAFHTIDYRVQRIDTFGDGDVWNRSGFVLSERNSKSKLLGANFLSSNQNLSQSYYYNGNIGFELNDKAKTFTMVKEPYLPSVLGSPAGQMLVEELLSIDTTYEAITYSKTPEGRVIHLKYPDQPELDVLERHTYLVLDEASYLPQIVRTSVLRGGRRWVTLKRISDVHLDAISTIEALQHPAFLTDYTPFVPTSIAEKTSSLKGLIAPNFRLFSLAKKSMKLSDHRGKVVVLDFWETSCAPCIASIPKLQQLQERYGNKLVVIGVLLDPDATVRAQGILYRQKAHYLNVVGTKAEEASYRIRGFPRYVVIGKDGKVLLDKEGGTFMQEVESAVKRAIEN